MSFKDILLEKNKKKENETSIKEDSSYHLHKVSRPHKKPTEKSRLDVGQRRPTQITKIPKTTYSQIAATVVNRGGSVIRSPGQITFRGTGKKAYKATKYAQLKLGKRKLTIKARKGADIHGRRAQQLRRIFSSYDEYTNDVMLEKHLSATLKSSDAHDMLTGSGFIVKSEGKHRKYYHPKTKQSLSISRTGNLSTGITSLVRKAINNAENFVTEEDDIKLLSPVSAKTQKVIDAGKKVNKELNKKDENKDSDVTKFQHSKTLTGASDKGNSTKTDVIEINPELKVPGKKEDKKEKK
jgi:hypothetical protein